MRIAALGAVMIATALAAMSPAHAQAPAGGTMERITAPGPALEGRLDGDSPDREVFVYLPPGYGADPDRRYPVIYSLHGYTATAEFWAGAMGLPQGADAAIAAGAQEMIIVAPDANTMFGGSMYSNSVTIGDWESFIADDLVAYIDSHYRTIPERASRGLAGHSMGGFGTVRIGMKRPDVFSSLYILSACCLGPRPADAGLASLEGLTTADQVREAGFAGLGTFAVAAAWSPNPDNPPFYVDLPTRDGEVRQDVLNRWAANAPLVMLDQYVPALKSYEAIAMDVGDEDPGLADIERLHERMTAFGVAHTYEVYQGDHGNRITQRWQENVIPFFAEHLDGE